MQFRNSWQIQRTVFLALFIRELKTRFGKYRLGFFWAMIEPIVHILVLTILFSLLRDRGDFYGIPFPLFFGVGVLAFFIFQKIVTGGINSISANLGLFAYRQVKPFDAIAVRAFLELLIICLVMVILTWLGAWFFDFETVPHAPLFILLVIITLFIFSLGLALMTSVIGVRYPEAAQLINMFMRPLYFLSGIFFPLQAMPEDYHVYLLWNPLLHGVEQLRAGWFSDYPADGTNIFYLFLWAMPIFFFGLAFYRNNRTRVLMS